MVLWGARGMADYVDVFEEAGLLREFVGVLDNINSTLAIVERYGLPPVIVRALIYDGLRMLDGFAREYRGYVGKVMDHVCEELHGLLYEILGGE
jgi:molybdopterin/thiamine biosynthesis adenylyltransferase